MRCDTPVAPDRRVVDEATLRAALDANGGNVTDTARRLGVCRMTIYRLKRGFSIE
jgi:transcriptional regulator of acetoin/glycerol metabolism